MSIVKMDRITIVGLRQEQTAVIEALMRLGAIDIDQEAGPSLRTALPEPADGRAVSLSGPEPGDAGMPAGDLPQLMARLQQAIAACAKLRPVKKPFLAKKRTVTAGQFESAIGSQISILADLARFEESGSRIAEIDSRLVRLQSTAAMLAPWAGLQIDLSDRRSLKTCSFLGSFKTRGDLESFEVILQNEAPESITQVLSEDESGLQVHVITLRIREKLVLAGLRRVNFAFLPVQDEAATPRDLLDRIQAEQGELLAARESESGNRYEIAGRLVAFEMLHDHLQMQNDRAMLLGRLAETGRTFYLKGWIPSSLAASLEKSLMRHFTVAVESRPARPDEPFPILLRNGKLLKPYEVVVEMFNPPLPSEVDPTPILAPFYFLFFGMMFSDVGYGLILSAICAAALYKLKVKGQSRRQFQLFFQCGLSAIFWGIMFGGYFGNMIAVLSGGRLNIPPVLFDPLREPTILMLISALLGIIHLFTGMAAKAYMMIRTGSWISAVLDVFPWYFVIVGLLMTLAGIGTPYAGYAALAGSAVIVLFSSRANHNPFARIGWGLYTLYGVTSYIGDILSYTRILALVLATSVIAMVVNLIGFLGGSTVIGLIMFVIVAVFGHALNFALSALSAYIHTSRLQFVEFFGKFYEGGGRLWQPETLTSRFVDIERDQAGKAADPTQA